MDVDLQEQLFRRYPANLTERSLPETETAMCRRIETGNSWFHIIDGLCARLEWETCQDGAPQVVATQVKEKYATLRFYRHKSTEVQSAKIDLAVDLSGRICDVCGAPGASVNVGRIRATQCPTHAGNSRQSSSTPSRFFRRRPISGIIRASCPGEARVRCPDP